MKNILMISPYFPLPANDGAKIRILNSIKELSKRANVYFISSNLEDMSEQNYKELQKYCKMIKIYNLKTSKSKALFRFFLSNKTYDCSKFYNYDLKKEINKILDLNKIDIIYCHFFSSLIYLDKKNVFKKYKIILDEHNADEDYWKKYLDSSNKMYSYIAKENIKRIRINQKEYSHLIDEVLSVSELDSKITKKWANKVLIIPNGVDFEYFKNQKGIKKENAIIFCASMDVTMNQEAVKYFCKKVFPFIKTRDIKIYIVGRNPSQSLKKLENKNIIITGTVEDVRKYYNMSKIAISPFEYGGGTKLKNLEAASMGIPIISTKIGIQGINFKNNEEFLLAEDEKEFAQKIDLLLNDEKMREKISLLAFEKAKQYYSWEKIFERIEL